MGWREHEIVIKCGQIGNGIGRAAALIVIKWAVESCVIWRETARRLALARWVQFPHFLCLGRYHKRTGRCNPSRTVNAGEGIIGVSGYHLKKWIVIVPKRGMEQQSDL